MYVGRYAGRCSTDDMRRLLLLLFCCLLADLHVDVEHVEEVLEREVGKRLPTSHKEEAWA